jgi:hypothetical protein
VGPTVRGEVIPRLLNHQRAHVLHRAPRAGNCPARRVWGAFGTGQGNRERVESPALRMIRGSTRKVPRTST